MDVENRIPPKSVVTVKLSDGTAPSVLVLGYDNFGFTGVAANKVVFFPWANILRLTMRSHAHPGFDEEIWPAT